MILNNLCSNKGNARKFQVEKYLTIIKPVYLFCSWQSKTLIELVKFWEKKIKSRHVVYNLFCQSFMPN